MLFETRNVGLSTQDVKVLGQLVMEIQSSVMKTALLRGYTIANVQSMDSLLEMRIKSQRRPGQIFFSKYRSPEQFSWA